MSLVQIQSELSGLRMEFLVQDDGGAPIDVSQSLVKEMIILAPDRQRYTVALDFITDGVDGKQLYITTSEEFVLKGTYKIQVHVRMMGDSTTEGITRDYYSSVQMIDVSPHL